jgi:hypothetical protein
VNIWRSAVEIQGLLLKGGLEAPRVERDMVVQSGQENGSDQ